MTRLREHFLLVAISCFVNIFAIQAEQYYYKQIPQEAGLSSTIQCVVKDEYNYVWVGTQLGLGRFDGENFKQYNHNPTIAHSLPSNRIFQLITDKQGNLWVLTNKGLARYHYWEDNFIPQKNEEGEDITAFSACNTPDGVLFGSSNKIYFYSYKKSCIEELCKIELGYTFNVTSLCMLNPHTVLCGARWQMRMRTIDLRTGELNKPPFDNELQIVAMYVDSSQRLWIAPYNGGVQCYGQDGNLIASYTTANSSLSNNIVLTIVERKGKMWFGTDGGGINILDPQTNQFTLLKHIPGRENHSLPNNSVMCLYNDYNNNVWIGSIHSGLIALFEVYIKTYSNVWPGNEYSLSNNIVLSLYQQSPNHIWVGTNGGLNQFYPGTEKFVHYPTTWNDKVVSICGFTSGRLLLSLFSQGIFVFDPRTGTKTPFIIIDEETNKRLCNRGKTVHLYQNGPDTVLLLGDHIYSYNINKKEFTIASEDEDITIAQGSFRTITYNEHSTYFYDPHHIYELNNYSNHLKKIFTAKEGVTMNAVTMDEHGRFWIGNSLGLTSYDPVKQTEKYIETTLFTRVSSVVCDQKDRVWIGADNMLFVWLPQEEKLTLFSKSDGAVIDEYFAEPRLITTQGDVYMGGTNGLLYIDNQIPSVTDKMPQFRLSNILVNGKLASNEQNNCPQRISVPWNSNIAIRVMAKDEDLFRKKTYRYQIKGLDEQFIESNNPELVMYALPPGNYQIMISCMTRDGSWTPLQQLLMVKITPPWYRTWWFIFICICCIVTIVFAAFWWMLKRKEEKLKWAMKEHEQKIYEEKVNFLINISHELRTPLTLIHVPLNRILKSFSAEAPQYMPLKLIYRQAQRMKSLINMVLDVRKMEVGESKLQIQPHRLNEWIEQILQDFSIESEAKHIQITVQPDLQIDTVSFDKDKCEIILNNLLINALKHSPENTEIIVESKRLSETDRVRISVSDRGKGIQQVDAQLLFTSFYQGAGEKSGTGIGLSYSKMLVELHKGSIGAYNNQHGGAVFFFELPLKQQCEEIICEPKAYLNELMGNDANKESKEEEIFNTQPYTVLVVDDNQELAEFLKSILTPCFKKVWIASDGAEALRLTKSYIPDIVVSDVMMPQMNGYELCKSIKEDIDISHVPVVLLTARDDAQSRVDGYKNGADAYLGKPFDAEVLIEVLRSKLKFREQIRNRYLNAGLVPIPEESSFSGVDEAFLIKLNRIIGENIDNNNLDIPFITKEIGMSRASLYNKLKALTNMATNEYINKIRMEKAIQLMISTNLTFTEISERVGFSSLKYFSTAFKQYTGETPTSYKKNKAQSSQ